MSLATSQAFTLCRVEARAYRFPIDQPVKTSFGVMRDRPAVFLRLEDIDGCYGYGEVFANWPAAAAEHRVNLLSQDFSDLLLGQRFDSPTALYNFLTRQTHITAIQSGEWGPFRQVIAGLDTAAWDLVARRQGLPLKNVLQESAADEIAIYASGIHIGNASAAIDAGREAGFMRFKVKVGFDIDADAIALNAIAQDLEKDEELFADANQAWTADEAISFVGKIEDETMGWLEEPLAADAPEHAWSKLLSNTRVPLAAGENIAGHRGFLDAIHGHVLSVIQPDVAKWGGISGCFEIGCATVAARKRYCPHFLGGGIGLLASAHLLAAVGGDGVMEVDVNPNPFRSCFEAAQIKFNNGRWKLPDSPGLGVDHLPEEIESWLTLESVRY